MEFLGGVAIWLGFCLAVIGVIGLIRPMKKVVTSRKLAAGTLALSLFSCGFGAELLPDHPKEAEAKTTSTNATQKAVSTAAVREKSEAVLKAQFVTLWRQVMTSAKNCDQANNRVIAALESGSPYASYEAADQGYDICQDTWSALARLSPPDSAKGEIAEKIEGSLENCEKAYLFRQMSMDKMRELIDGGMKPSAMQAYKEDAEMAQAGVLACVAGMMSAGSEIGIDAKEMSLEG